MHYIKMGRRGQLLSFLQTRCSNAHYIYVRTFVHLSAVLYEQRTKIQSFIPFDKQSCFQFTWYARRLLLSMWTIFNSNLRAKTSNGFAEFKGDAFIFAAYGHGNVYDITQMDRRLKSIQKLILIKNISILCRFP